MVSDAIFNPFDPRGPPLNQGGAHRPARLEIVIRNQFMLRFVVLIHDHPRLHWDFMLEKEATLRTWRLARPPDEAGPIEAQPLPDHRLAYLDYEGPVSGNRGSVRRFDRGKYTLIEETGDALVVELQGSILKGKAHVKRDDNSDGWWLSFTPARGI